jgi:hypothetical protein
VPPLTSCKSVTGIRARDLNDFAVQAFGKAAPAIQKRIDGMGGILGAPWTTDEKAAALAAAVVLNRAESKGRAAHGTWRIGQKESNIAQASSRMLWRAAVCSEMFRASRASDSHRR